MSAGEDEGPFPLELDDADPRYAPRGSAHDLGRAMRELVGDRGPGSREFEAARLGVWQLAAEFNAGVERQKDKARLPTVAAQLAAIEDACTALVEAFDGAGLAAYDVLHGYGALAGLPLRLHGAADEARYRALRDLAGRYHLPLSQPKTPEVLEALLAEPSGFDFTGASLSLDWPTAIAALGAAVGRQRTDFEQAFREERVRVEGVRDHGPEGDLRPGRLRGRQGRGKLYNAPRTGAASRTPAA